MSKSWLKQKHMTGEEVLAFIAKPENEKCYACKKVFEQGEDMHISRPACPGTEWRARCETCEKERDRRVKVIRDAIEEVADKYVEEK